MADRYLWLNDRKRVVKFGMGEKYLEGDPGENVGKGNLKLGNQLGLKTVPIILVLISRKYSQPTGSWLF